MYAVTLLEQEVKNFWREIHKCGTDDYKDVSSRYFHICFFKHIYIRYMHKTYRMSKNLASMMSHRVLAQIFAKLNTVSVTVINIPSSSFNIFLEE